MNWERSRIGLVADFVRGITFKPEDIVPFGSEGSIACFRTKNVQVDLETSDVWAVPASFVKQPERLLQAGDVIMSTANSWSLVGKCSWVPNLEYRATVGGFVSVLRGRVGIIDRRYLYHWLNTSSTQANLRKCARQTTNISNLSISQAENIEIPLPPLAEQKRIAGILDQADALRRLRARALEKLNTLGQAVFQEMFGDPESNPKGWPMGKVSDLLSEANYGTSGKANTAHKGLPILRMGNISYDGAIGRCCRTVLSAGFTKRILYVNISV